jgi:hypothetical protein
MEQGLWCVIDVAYDTILMQPGGKIGLQTRFFAIARQTSRISLAIFPVAI